MLRCRALSPAYVKHRHGPGVCTSFHLLAGLPRSASLPPEWNVLVGVQARCRPHQDRPLHPGRSLVRTTASTCPPRTVGWPARAAMNPPLESAAGAPFHTRPRARMSRMGQSATAARGCLGWQAASREWSSSGSRRAGAHRATEAELKPGDHRRIAGDNRFLAQRQGMAETGPPQRAAGRCRGRRRGEGRRSHGAGRCNEIANGRNNLHRYRDSVDSFVSPGPRVRSRHHDHPPSRRRSRPRQKPAATRLARKGFRPRRAPPAARIGAAHHQSRSMTFPAPCS